VLIAEHVRRASACLMERDIQDTDGVSTQNDETIYKDNSNATVSRTPKARSQLATAMRSTCQGCPVRAKVTLGPQDEEIVGSGEAALSARAQVTGIERTEFSYLTTKRTSNGESNCLGSPTQITHPHAKETGKSQGNP
jgi:hypothetical protein